jgi:low affinity Fe/Cu permease
MSAAALGRRSFGAPGDPDLNEPAVRSSQMHAPYGASPFARFSKWTAHATGHPLAFLMATLIIVVWGVTGPLFGFSDTWQLVINTGTTIVTFLMVFLIQRSQSKDALAIQLKLDELVAAMSEASNELVGAEDLSEEDLDALRRHYKELSERARRTAKKPVQSS